ncbi:MAG: TonB-dependent receptor domain-containing protein [Aestuariibacter sp.]
MNNSVYGLLGLSFALTPLAFAQSENETTETIEKIQVTGSNIRGIDLEGAQPLQVIGAEEIKKSGADSIFDLLKDLGQTRGGSGTFGTSESGSTSNSTPAGQAAASLRGLGPASTLTLINGRRVAPSSFAAGTENFVDINSIPLAAIERIEILATGASAIYGADAVAGVINYILKKDYEGAELNVSFQDSFEDSDESRKNLNIVWGGQLFDGNVTLFADIYDKNAFTAQDRDYTKDPLLVNSYSYLPKLPYPNIYFNSVRDGGVELPNPDCPQATVRTEFDEDICAYYGNQDDMLDAPVESYSLGAIYNKTIGQMEWNTDIFYSRSKSVAVSSPAPIDNIDDSEGPLVPFSALDIYTGEELEAWLGSADPFDALWDDPIDTQAGQRLFGFAFDARFGTPRTIENETESVRLVSSLSGEFGQSWQWETGLTFSESTSKQQAVAGIHNRYKFHAALHGELCSNGDIAILTDDTLNCSSGSLLGRFNPFLIGDASNDAILQSTEEQPTRDGTSRVYGIDAKFNGEVMEFGADSIRAALGVEYRHEELDDVPSLNSRADFNNGYLVDVFGFGSSFATAERTQVGAFAEFYIPLTESLDVQVAGRFDHFDDFGSTFNPKINFSYRASDNLILRGGWATSYRAPSLTQAGIELRTTTSTYDCGANRAVADLYCEGDGVERSPNALELGNPQLQAEESDSISLGFAWSPTDDTTITLDYWAFEHEKIVDTNMTGILASAIDDASLRHCGLVPTGEIGISYDPDLCLVTDENGLTIEQDGANLTQILAAWNEFDQPRFVELPLFRDHVIPLENTGTQEVSGIDLDIAHDFTLANGTVSVDLDWTHYLKFDRNKPGSDEIESLVGTFRYPENIANMRLGWSTDQFFSSVTVRYTDGYEDDISGLRGREIDELLTLGALDANEQRQVDSWTVIDLNAGYDFEDSTISINIDNLFDKEPPVVYGSRRGFDSINHNALGRTFRVSYTHFFE